MTRAWRTLFAVELPMVAATVIYWLIAPADYLSRTLGIASPSAGDVDLLMMYAGTTFALVFWLYARILVSADLHLPTFRRFQEALLISDAAIVLVGARMAWGGRGDPLLLAIQIGLAAVWGLIRAGFLVTTRPGARA